MREELIAGDSLDEEVEIVDSAGNEYTGEDGWAARYRFTPRGGGSGAAFEIYCTWTGDVFRYQASTAQSAGWTPDNYSWALIVTKAGLQVTVAEGTAIVTPNRATVAVYDSRSAAEKALDDAKAALYTFNASGGAVKSYSIAGRAMEFETREAIITMISQIKVEVAQERRIKSMASGLGDPFRLFTRM